MKKAKDWDGRPMLGTWVVSLKIDGVRALSDGQNVCSRKGKKLYGLDHLAHTFRDAEVFCGSFKQTVEVVRSHNSRRVEEHELFPLDPLDERLFLGTVVDPSSEQIKEWLKLVVERGHEGLVLRRGDEWWKCKPVQTYDVPITGVQAGAGKFNGMMGALHTPMGKVGTGFTDAERRLEWKVGEVIEVACLQLTPDGKFRHPRFVRHRFDK